MYRGGGGKKLRAACLGPGVWGHASIPRNVLVLHFHWTLLSHTLFQCHAKYVPSTVYSLTWSL